jgi:hypothetical protein
MGCMDDNKLREILESMIPAFSKLTPSNAWSIIHCVNDKLAGTPFMFLLCGDGIFVLRREQMVATARALYNSPQDGYVKDPMADG